MNARYGLIVEVLILSLLSCSCSRQEQVHVSTSLSTKSDALQIQFRTPPWDYSAWQKEFGADEPDQATDAGRKRLQEESARLNAAKARFKKILDDLPNAYTNSSEQMFRDALLRIDTVLMGFSRESSAAILKVVVEKPSLIRPDWSLFLSCQESVRLIGRYATLAARLADLAWIKAGEAYSAAEIDSATFGALQGIRWYCGRRKWNDAQSEAERWFDKFTHERCDNEQSNFCRAHIECEQRYSLHFAELVRKDPRLMKPLSNWYRRHLRRARNILRREPKWSPDFRAK